MRRGEGHVRGGGGKGGEGHEERVGGGGEAEVKKRSSFRLLDLVWSRLIWACWSDLGTLLGGEG